MKAELGRYFLAIIPPDPLASVVRQWQLELATEFATKASLRSPPHITLHMPFQWKVKREQELCEALRDYFSKVLSLKVVLEGVGAFPPRVIFINVDKSEELVACQRGLARFCRANFDIRNSDYGDQPFHPHLTLAFRDLRKAVFPMAWEAFRSRSFRETFTASHVAILRHNGTEWTVHQQMPLRPTDPS
jgi:2'-5' RNA ligase